ncbi:MAG: tRNA pseudouridine(13) synthase TruD [Chloroflexi bacterium]|nr:tRNA pseudouridine(13) synthase TruD [Chloroflexota bacterium]
MSDSALFPPLLTADLPGTGGVIRRAPDDFVVAEVPAYAPTGSGEHVLFEIEKRGLTTFAAIDRLAQALDISPKLIGCAGLKDAQAVTRQWLSAERTTPEAVLAVEVSGVRVLSAARHRNRLKIGHLRGNRFSIRLRDTQPGALSTARAVVRVLERRGLPNGFGPQRFGLHANSHLLGRSLLRQDATTMLHHLLGDPHPDDAPAEQHARELADAGAYAEALAAWPYASANAERRVLQALVGGRSPEQALRALPPHLTRLYVAAYQAYLFNRLLAPRVAQIERLADGDLAIKHANGAFFLVENAALEQPRADALEISASAPLFSHRVRLAQGQPGERERALLAAEGLALDTFRLPGLDLRGDRRPLRVPVSAVAVEDDGEGGLWLRFALPSGAYATALLAEVTKARAIVAPED